MPKFKLRPWLALCLVLMAEHCAYPLRPDYNRSHGEYRNTSVFTKRNEALSNPKINNAFIEVVEESTSAETLDESSDNEDVPKSESLKKIAESYLGVPYSFGGQSRAGFDCSGFVRQIFLQVYNRKLPHSSVQQYHLGEPVSRANLRVGDLVFFRNWLLIDHAGIYMGQNRFIHSASHLGVSYATLDDDYFADHYAGARRIIGIEE